MTRALASSVFNTDLARMFSTVALAVAGLDDVPSSDASLVR